MATDGGLGGKVGSRVCLLFSTGEDCPIVQGYAAEVSKFDTMQSTMEELLGMLAFEYMMRTLGRVWGILEQ